MTKLVGSHYFQVRAFRGAHGPFFVVVEVCVARYSGGTREKGVCESSTSSVERATVSVVVALEVDDDICVTAGNLPEPQRRDAAPLIEALMRPAYAGSATMGSSACTQSPSTILQFLAILILMF